MKQRQLIWHIYPWFLLITLVAILVVSWFTSNAFQRFTIKKTESDLLNQCRLLKGQMSRNLLHGDPRVIDHACKAFGKEASTRITVMLPDGRVVCDSEKKPDTMDNHRDRPEFIQALQEGMGMSIRHSRTLNEKLMYVAIPLRDPSGIIGVLRTSIPVTSLDEELKTIEIKIIFGGLVVAFLSAVISLYVSRRIAYPIAEMKSGAERFAGGELDHRLPTPPSLELAGLSEAMNRMAGQLESRMKTIVTQRNEYEAVLSSMTEGVIAVDNNDRLLNMNKAAVTILGIDALKTQGRTIQETLRNPDFLKFVEDSQSGKVLKDKDFEITEDTGKRIINIRSAPLMDAKKQHIGILIVLNDVTKIRRLENVRKDFVANVSHEIKTPLTAIKGFVETLYQSLNHPVEDTEKFLAIIMRHVDRLNAIIEDLLALSRIEQIDGKEELRLEPRHLKNLIENSANLLLHKANIKQIAFDIDCEPDVIITVESSLFEQSLINLLDNAVAYSPDNSVVRVTTKSDNKEFQISVIDQGPGIAHIHLSRIFERFYRVDKARSRKMGGTGLGLAIVKHIVQAHGGRVSVKSELGKGSTFTIHLPASVVSFGNDKNNPK